MKLEYLKQFIAIHKSGNMTKASDDLHVSQSTLTRNMFRLEQILNVKLFYRSANHIELTQTGEFALSKFETLLEQHRQMVDSIKSFDTQSSTLKGGVCSQGPAWKIKQITREDSPVSHIAVSLEPEIELIRQLKTNSLDFIVTSYPLQENGIESHYIFSEQLYLSIPEDHPLSHKDKITFDQLSGQSLIIRTDLGVWQTVINDLQNINFIVQDRTTFDELVGKFSLPAFTTNISQNYNLGDKRKNLVILDASAAKKYYLSFSSRNKRRIEFLLDELSRS